MTRNLREVACPPERALLRECADVVIEKRCKVCGVWDAGVHAVGGCLGGGTLSVACE
jgi:hypothetical protein